MKNRAEGLRRCLKSLYANFVRECDEVVIGDTGSTDGGATLGVATEFGARVIDLTDLRHDISGYIDDWLPEHREMYNDSDLATGCILDFSEARQRVTDALENDIQFWIDSDDELVEQVPGKLRQVVDQVYGGPTRRGDSIFLDYLYSFDPHDGTCTSVLKRERIFDASKHYWKGRCHESAIPRPDSDVRGSCYFHDLKSAIKHHKPVSQELKMNSSDLRNYVIIRREIEECEKEKKWADPRSIYYLGNAARGCQKLEEAIECYKRFIPISGSRDDRFSACYYLATIYVRKEIMRPADALDWYIRCMVLKPEDPRGPFGVSRSYFFMDKYNEALHWFNVGRTLPEPTQSLHNYDPRHVHVLPYQIAALAMHKLDDIGGSMQIIEELERRSPNHPETAEMKQFISNWIAGEKLTESVRQVVAQSGAKDWKSVQRIGREIVSKFQDVPKKLEDSGLAHVEPADERTGDDLVIYCGKAWEPWGPKSGETGIGGSEKAVIYMSRCLQARGFRVTVYADVPREDRGVDPDTGVNWQHHGAFDFDRPRGTVIFWRAPEYLELQIPAEKRIVWCHDVQDPRRWTPERIALADQVWVLSDFHASTLGPVRGPLGNKLVITRNGIDSKLYESLYNEGNRNPKKIVFASSPDRGVLSAIQLYQRAKLIDPELELHVYYGFTKVFHGMAAKAEYGSIPDLGRDANRNEYHRDVMAVVDNDDSIKWHGRVNWEKLAAEFCSAGIWLYPTRFPEISCMGAMEAQAAGLAPVCSTYAALAETVSNPYTVNADSDQDENVRALIEATKISPTERILRAQAAQKKFSYERLADEWVSLIRGCGE